MSTIFYAWGGPRFLLLIYASITINYLAGLFVSSASSRKIAKTYLTIAILINFALIGYFKYANFFADNLNAIGLFDLELQQIVLPLGISFFTFQSVSYIIDVYKNQVEVQKNYFNYALYIIFFPQLIAGPIVRYSEVAKAITSRKETLNDVTIGVQRFIIGLAKKMIIANNAGAIADEIFNQQGNISTTTAWIGAIAYTLQIYFDFSGYSDMAIGIGRMFGFRFPENFNYPYISKSISEFWRRWHITLGRWFRDYLYIPLGGNRVSGFRLYLNLFLVWFATGFWHGASWVFIFWGLYFMVLMIFERKFLSKVLSKLPNAFSYTYALFAVVLGWVLFRSQDVSSALSYYKTMFGIDAELIDTQALQYLSQNYVILLAGVIFSTPILSMIRKRYLKSNKKPVNLLGINVLEPAFYIAVFVMSLVYITSSTFNPFIYFRF